MALLFPEDTSRSSSPEREQPRGQPVRAVAGVASSLSRLHSFSRSTFRQCPTHARVSARSEGGGFEETYVRAGDSVGGCLAGDMVESSQGRCRAEAADVLSGSQEGCLTGYTVRYVTLVGSHYCFPQDD